MALTANEIKNVCTCGMPTETSPALHSGLCAVWAAHHNLVPADPAMQDELDR